MEKSLTINNRNHLLLEDEQGFFIADSALLIGKDKNILRSELELKINSQLSTNKEGGRGVVQKIVFGENSIIIRNYLRGGLVRFLNRATFFGGYRKSASKYRMISEYETLSFLHSQSCGVPQPIFALASFSSSLKGFAYRGLIGTVEIKGATNLFQQAKNLSLAEQVGKLFTKSLNAGVKARKITELGVIHSDLHLANVVEDGEGNVYILDFDRAQRRIINENSREDILGSLCERWDRFIRKNKLAEELCEAFHQGLMSENR